VNRMMGVHIINYTSNVYIVLEAQENTHPEYLGWFYIGKSKINNPHYNYCCEKDGLFLYRAKDDDNNCGYSRAYQLLKLLITDRTCFCDSCLDDLIKEQNGKNNNQEELKESNEEVIKEVK